MHWLTLSAIIIWGGALSLRYHTLSQNNGYELPFNKRLLAHFLPCAAVSVPPVLIISIISGFPAYVHILLSFYFLVMAAVFILAFTKNKTRLKFTRRATLTFIFCNYIQMMFGVILALYIGVRGLLISAVCLYVITPIFVGGLLQIINPVFMKNNRNFVMRCAARLKQINPVRIGITGSYGKTGCKNILYHLLKNDFQVYATEKNYNTPMGIAIAIDKMPAGTQVFIAEMGARRTGDIEELCAFVKPDFGIVTGVTNQHLSTFGTVENIYEEKAKLAKFVEEKGLCVFNGSDKYSLKMYKQHKGKKLIVRLNNFADVFATDIELTSAGSSFVLNYKDESIGCQTHLFGRHNIQNILMCVGIAIYMGVTLESIVSGIASLPYAEHRLQLIKSNGINILDDSYNANTAGARYALETLSYFDTRKIVFTQGMVELGAEGEKANIMLGRQIAQVADAVILCGINSADIRRGLTEAEYQKSVYEFATLKEAQSAFGDILKKGDTLLIQNDLPDVF